MDRFITMMLHGLTAGIEIIGYIFLAIAGYGLYWGPPFHYGSLLRNPSAAMRMEGFYSGLAVTPILTAFVVSFFSGRWSVVMWVGGIIIFALLLYKYFKRNVFLPFFCGLFITVAVIGACLTRLSVILVLFFFYTLLVLLGPLLLFFFLAAL